MKTLTKPLGKSNAWETEHREKIIKTVSSLYVYLIFTRHKTTL